MKVMEYLEPFMIYSDDITYKQYEIIKEFILDEITEHKKIIYQGDKDE